MGRWGLLLIPSFIWMTLFSSNLAKAKELLVDNIKVAAALAAPSGEVLIDHNQVESLEPLTSEIYFDIPITINDRVERFIKRFQTEKREPFRNWLVRLTRYAPRMRGILRENGLPEDLVYLAMIESGFNVSAYSPAHACGPWQFIKETAKRYNLQVNDWLDERRNPEKSTRAAANYLKNLYREFGCWYLAAAAYNAGENRVRRIIATYGITDFWEMCGYDLFPKETRDFVPQMIAAAIIAKDPERYGFIGLEYQQPIHCATVSVPPEADLKAVALACGVDYQVLSGLNPELRRGCTPPGNYYLVNIPESNLQFFKDNFARVKPVVKIGYHRYVVEKGDTLAIIAQKFDISQKALARANKIKRPRSIKKGKALRVPYEVREYVLSPKKAQSAVKIAARPPGRAQDITKAKLIDKVQIARVTKEERIYAGQAKVKYHRVRKGDTIWHIAQKYDVTPAEIRSWNNIRRDIILPGVRLKVRRSSTI